MCIPMMKSCLKNSMRLKPIVPFMIAVISCLFLVVPIMASDIKEGEAAVDSVKKIEWMSFEGALQHNGMLLAQGKQPKKVFIDVYTDWCGWCKRLDASTFSHPEIIRYMDSAFIAVKLNAERTDSVLINGQWFVNRQAASGKRGSHDIAIALLKGKMSYPSCTFLDENGSQITVVPGFMGPAQMEAVLHFIAEDAYKTMKWEDFQEKFKSRARIRE